MSKKIKLDTGSLSTDTQEVEVRQRKIPKRSAPNPDDILGESDSHSEVLEKRKSVTQIDVNEDVFRRIRKEMGLFKFIPLSTGKLCDLWWRPTQISLVERSKGLSPQMLNIHTEILLDTAPNLITPVSRTCEVVFRTDIEEILKISFLIDRFQKELHSEKLIKYENWIREMARRFRLESLTDYTAVFAKQVLEYVMSLVITRVPKSFHLFLCKKPTWEYIFPTGCISGENRNSIACSSPSGFKYEYRCRLFICDIPEVEELGDDEEDIPESQPY